MITIEIVDDGLAKNGSLADSPPLECWCSEMLWTCNRYGTRDCYRGATGAISCMGSQAGKIIGVFDSDSNLETSFSIGYSDRSKSTVGMADMDIHLRGFAEYLATCAKSYTIL